MDDLSFLRDAPIGNVRINVCSPDGNYTSIPNVDFTLLAEKCPVLAEHLQKDGDGFNYTFMHKSDVAIVSLIRYIYLGDYTFCEAGLEKPCSLVLHLGLYQLADMLHLLDLRELVRDNIIEEAERFRDTESPMHGFYEGIRFLYTDLREHVDLRRLLVYYCVMCFDHFKFARSETFRQTAYESALFHRDLQQANSWSQFSSKGAMEIVQLPVCSHRMHNELDFTCHLHSFSITFDNTSSDRSSHATAKPLFPSAWTDDNPAWYALGKTHSYNGWQDVLNAQSNPSGQPLAHWNEPLAICAADGTWACPKRRLDASDVDQKDPASSSISAMPFLSAKSTPGPSRRSAKRPLAFRERAHDQKVGLEAEAPTNGADWWPELPAARSRDIERYALHAREQRVGPDAGAPSNVSDWWPDLPAPKSRNTQRIELPFRDVKNETSNFDNFDGILGLDNTDVLHGFDFDAFLKNGPVPGFDFDPVHLKEEHLLPLRQEEQPPTPTPATPLDKTLDHDSDEELLLMPKKKRRTSTPTPAAQTVQSPRSPSDDGDSEWSFVATASPRLAAKPDPQQSSDVASFSSDDGRSGEWCDVEIPGQLRGINK